MRLRVADFPHQKQNQRSVYHRSIHKLAYPETYAQKRLMSNEEVARRIGMLTNGK